MDRLPIALHLSQDLLPLSGAGSSSSKNHGAARGQQPSKVVGTGAGYGPPLPADGTPLSRLVSSVLYVPPREPTPAEAAQGWTPSRGGKTEYDLVAIPLANANWQERWERMCTITASATEADLGAVAAGLTQQGEEQRIESEDWRAGGGFLRTEVNITRSGTLFSLSLHNEAALIPLSARAEESGNLITFASDWLELDSPVEGIRFDAELALRQEIAYASYLSITTIVVPPPKLENREYLADYARAINGALASSWHINVSHTPLSCSDGRHSETDPGATTTLMQISIRLPIAEYSPAELAARPGTPAFAAVTGDSDRCETWELWNTLRGLCGYSPRLTLSAFLSRLSRTGFVSSADSLFAAASPRFNLRHKCSTFRTRCRTSAVSVDGTPSRSDTSSCRARPLSPTPKPTPSCPRACRPSSRASSACVSHSSPLSPTVTPVLTEQKCPSHLVRSSDRL